MEKSETKTIMFAMLSKHCPKCGVTKLHEHGNILLNGKIIRKIWICIACGRTYTEVVE